MRRVPFFSKRHIQFCIKSRNEMFSQRFSPTTGKMEWVVEDNDYDMRNEIARSAYTDMLHDNERNEKYYQATMKAVRRLKDRGKKIHMLDIGTGTGLLAMMAVRSGADGSTACEAFGPIANVAKKIVEKNGFGEKISVIGNRSTDLELKKDGHILSRANLLVTELWDTELIGEGALPTLRDACCRLLEPDFVSVPAAATVYAQVVGSESLWNMHQLDAKQISDDLDVTLPTDTEECGGTAGVFDLHVDELLNNEIHILSAPVPVLRFDFCNNFASEKSDCINRVSIPDTQDKMDSDQTVSQYCAQTSVMQSGVSHCIIMWWTLDMDIDGEITLTTAPRWAHPKGVNRQWRDHWMQAVYFFKRPLCVQEGDMLNIQCCHDDYSIWFDVTKSTKIATTVIDRPLCTCGAHVTWSRHRFAMLNNKQRSQKFRQALKQLVEEGNSRCLCIGDGSLLPVLAAKAGFEKVVTLESSVLYQKFLRKLIDLNDLGDQIEIIGREATSLLPQDLPSDQIDVILGEPFFNSALFPWHNLYFWYAASSIAKIVKPGVQILPGSATLRAMAVEFEDLWKFHAPVNIVQGFDVSLFDELIEGSKLTNEEINNESSHGIALEPHHLWEYPCRALGQETSIMKFDLTSNIPSQKIASVGDIKLTRSGILHGIVLWMDFNLAEKLSVTTGLQRTEKLNGKEWKLPWVRHTKQGVYFMKSSPRIQEESLLKNNTPSVRYSVNFEPTTGEIDFDFQLCPS